jgi:hypothetical protein
MIVLLLSALAAASPCPWEASPTVYSTMTSVTVGGRHYDVRGAAREALRRDLAACGAEGAIPALEAWRKSRRATNTWGVIGAFTWYGFIGCAVTGPAANRNRRAFEVALRDAVR